MSRRLKAFPRARSFFLLLLLLIDEQEYNPLADRKEHKRVIKRASFWASLINHQIRSLFWVKILFFIILLLLTRQTNKRSASTSHSSFKLDANFNLKLQLASLFRCKCFGGDFNEKAKAKILTYSELNSFILGQQTRTKNVWLFAILLFLTPSLFSLVSD